MSEVRRGEENLGRPSPFAADHRSSAVAVKPNRRRRPLRRRSSSVIGRRCGEYRWVRLVVLYA
uniref:Uncharacterized protein n=1 Tax=Oryza sativa subsp. japonica TaxID=39947 RepID=Q6YSV8_ORYSJ|nr:hypothetical protein [Oryza sativa Japonica Group]